MENWWTIPNSFIDPDIADTFALLPQQKYLYEKNEYF